MKLDQNCNRSLSEAACALGNISGLFSTAIWFTVLVPQLVRNNHRGSVEGLNVLWAIANFSASLCHVFFSFQRHVPIQMRIQAVYMPCLEFLMLMQFWFYWDKHREPYNGRQEPTNALAALLQSKYLIAALCIPVWLAVVLVQVAFSHFTDYFEWSAVVLWSLETFPQLWTNISDTSRSVSGQSVVGLLIASIGKTTDCVATYLLVMPMQYKVVAFFSSTSAWLNAFMVLVTYAQFYDLHNTPFAKDNRSIGSTMQRNRNDDELEAEMIDGVVMETTIQRSGEEDDNATNIDDSSRSGVSSYCPYWFKSIDHQSSLLQSLEQNIRWSLATSSHLRFFAASLLSGLMLGVVVACFLTIGNPWIVFLMIGISAILVASFHCFSPRRLDNYRLEMRKAS